MTVAVLSTGVDGSHPDLAGTVTTGPDFAKTGRGPGQAYWADEGTAVAGLIAGHGHGAGGSEGVTGIAPGARILSVQVTLEYNDPLDPTRPSPAGCPPPSRPASGTRSATAPPSSRSRSIRPRWASPPPARPPRPTAAGRAGGDCLRDLARRPAGGAGRRQRRRRQRRQLPRRLPGRHRRRRDRAGRRARAVHQHRVVRGADRARRGRAGRARPRRDGGTPGRPDRGRPGRRRTRPWPRPTCRPRSRPAWPRSSAAATRG